MDEQEIKRRNEAIAKLLGWKYNETPFNDWFVNGIALGKPLEFHSSLDWLKPAYDIYRAWIRNMWPIHVRNTHKLKIVKQYDDAIWNMFPDISHHILYRSISDFALNKDSIEHELSKTEEE